MPIPIIYIVKRSTLDTSCVPSFDSIKQRLVLQGRVRSIYFNFRKKNIGQPWRSVARGDQRLLPTNCTISHSVQICLNGNWHYHFAVSLYPPSWCEKLISFIVLIDYVYYCYSCITITFHHNLEHSRPVPSVQMPLPTFSIYHITIKHFRVQAYLQ